jgi:hypothetical protein
MPICESNPGLALVASPGAAAVRPTPCACADAPVSANAAATIGVARVLLNFTVLPVVLLASFRLATFRLKRKLQRQ